MSYLSRFLNPTYAKETVDDVVKALQAEARNFDSIAIRGVSGGLIGPAVAMALNKHILVVRKGEENHSQAPVEMRDHPRRYIIIDDLIESGKTVWSIMATIREAVGLKATCVGAYFYAQHGRSLEWIKGTYVPSLLHYQPCHRTSTTWSEVPWTAIYLWAARHEAELARKQKIAERKARRKAKQNVHGN